MVPVRNPPSRETCHKGDSVDILGSFRLPCGNVMPLRRHVRLNRGFDSRTLSVFLAGQVDKVSDEFGLG